MILFFKTSSQHVIATEINHQPDTDEVKKLCWLYDNAELLTNEKGEPETSLAGFFIGPRREMITPWSTNAVEITQNMLLSGITRIEEYFPAKSEDAEHDEMLQRMYKGLDQTIFTVNKQPEPIKYIENIEEHNEQEGLALSKEEIEYLYKVAKQLGRPLTDSELFGFAQINSEHCRHKIFGGTFIIDGKEMESSLFQMIKKTTQENPNKILSAYKDNVAFAAGPEIEQFSPANHAEPDTYKIKKVESVISLKAETHNFPTTVEPFNGAATGTGGEIRDRMGGGVGSWPIAGTAVYMTSYPRKDKGDEHTDGQLHWSKDKDCQAWEKIMPIRKWLYQTPEQILIKASNGASDFGNKFGQPLICGSVLTFEHQEPNSDEQYAYDKVIMLAGGVGYGIKRDCLKGEPQPGNKIVVMGGENYRIGLGGGSVSSVETGRYSSGIELNAVQRANPEMQKRAYNVIRALGEEDKNPIVSIHDHGSAGHVNCLSELVEECGGLIHMDKLPVGDKTLSAKEIIANESQERMGLLIDESSIEHVQKIADRERAPMYTVGETTGDHRFAFEQADGERPFDLAVEQMFGSSPKTIMDDKTVTRKYDVVTYDASGLSSNTTLNEQLTSYLKDVLQLEAVACKDWLTNKVDRSVTGRVARQQCQGELQLPLSDCGVVALDYTGTKGIATSLGHAPQAALANPEAGSVLSVAEALTNLVWAPLDTPEGKGSTCMDSISLSANWMWPCRAQQGEDARLYSAVKALSDFCLALQVNVPTGKDSLSMTQKYPDGKKIIAPGTVIVSAGGEVSDVKKTVSPVINTTEKNTRLYYIDFSFDKLQLGGSAFAQSRGKVGSDVPTVMNPEYFRDAFIAIQQLVSEGLVLAGHDISAGGIITCLLEMCFANTKGGLDINFNKLAEGDIVKILFAENPGVVIQVKDSDATRVKKILDDAGVGYAKIGNPTVSEGKRLITIAKTVSNANVPNTQLAARDMVFTFDIEDLRDVWYKTSFLLDRRQSFNGKAAERFANYSNIPVEWSLSGEPLKAESRDNIKGKRPLVAVIREKGSNSEREMAWSFYQAGFDVKDVTMTDLITGRETLEEVNVIAFCGGFSNSDVLGSAKGWAGAFLYNPKAKEALDKFYSRQDTLSFGVCNGCQLMIELGLIDNNFPLQSATEDRLSADRLLQYKQQYAQMQHNDSHKFESTFVTLQIPQNNSVMFGSLSGQKIGCWVAHGEGKFHLPQSEDKYNIVAKYNRHGYPANPNGSDYDVAALASADGRHLAIMPHPERTQHPWQCGYYPVERRMTDTVTPWHEAFVNARKWVEERM
ncbi:MAG: phosphoribosylformylglycinamidine synthase [Prevotella sp.]|nr:phosphoribosylformylglycinamidine synthase [Prevotella sp.]